MNLHGRVAFMTLVPTVLKGLRPLEYNLNPVTLGEHLRKRRIELGLFQKDVAERLNMNEMTVLKWEHDRATPPVSFWPRIISFLGFDPSPAPQTLGERIAARRRALGVDQRGAAKIVGVDYTTLMRYESGEWIPKGERLNRVQAFCSRECK